MSTKTGYNLVKSIAEHNQDIFIKESDNNLFNDDIFWSHHVISSIPTSNGIMNNIPYISLAHELAHAYSKLFKNGPDLTVWYTLKYKQDKTMIIYQDEIYATHIENKIRTEHHLPLRIKYTIHGPIIIDKHYRNIYFDNNDLFFPNPKDNTNRYDYYLNYSLSYF